MNFFPSKKIAALFASLLVLVAAGFLVARYKSPGPTPSLSPVEENDVLSEAIAEYLSKKDTDADGLRDWEEALWGTDTRNPDSDGDGTRDGEEVSAGRNPRVAGPEDELSSTLPEKSSSEEPLTETDRVARDIFADYLSLKQSGNLTEEAQEELILSSLETSLGESSARIYTVSDLKITSEGGAPALRAYGNAVGKALKENSVETENEAVIVLRALQEESEAILRGLDPVIASYEAIERALLAIPAPEEAAAAHLSLLNGVAGMAAVSSNMRKVFSDPVAGLAGVGRYLAAAQGIRDALQKLDALFAGNAVTFAENENGSYIRFLLSL